MGNANTGVLLFTDQGKTGKQIHMLQKIMLAG